MLEKYQPIDSSASNLRSLNTIKKIRLNIKITAGKGKKMQITRKTNRKVGS